MLVDKTLKIKETTFEDVEVLEAFMNTILDCF